MPYDWHQRHLLLLHYLRWRARGMFRLMATCCTELFLTYLYPDSGAFDAPKPKCPPDRGSSDCVTGNPAPMYSTFPHFSPSPDYDTNSKNLVHPFIEPLTTTAGYTNRSHPISAPRAIPVRNDSELSTPPLTPDSGSECSISDGSPKFSAVRRQNDALDFLMTLFPNHGVGALPFAKSVSISSNSTMGAAFDGVVLELPGKPKTLYVDGKSAESVSLRERFVVLFCVDFGVTDPYILVALLHFWI